MGDWFIPVESRVRMQAKPTPKPGQQMPTDIVSPHNNVISFQIRLRQCVPTLHASAVPLPGWGHARFMGYSHQALGHSRKGLCR